MASRRAGKESKKKGLLRGIGICFVLEHSGGSPTEGTQIQFPGGEKLTFVMNVQSTGQSHATIFPRMVAERLGIKAEQVGHAHGDSAHEIAGYASVGSRTAMTAGHAMVKTLEAMLEKGKKVAAQCSKPAKATSSTGTAPSTWSAPTAGCPCSTSPNAPRR